MKIIKHFLLYSIIWFWFLLGSFSSAQIFIPDEDEPVFTQSFNVVESVNGANVRLDDSVVANKIWQPMFHWYSQLLNLWIVFYPIILVVSGFRFAYWVVKSVINKNNLNNKKSLDNR